MCKPFASCIRRPHSWVFFVFPSRCRLCTQFVVSFVSAAYIGTTEFDVNDIPTNSTAAAGNSTGAAVAGGGSVTDNVYFYPTVATLVVVFVFLALSSVCKPFVDEVNEDGDGTQHRS